MKDVYPPIGFVSTCFKEKFGTPRQSLLVSEAKGILKLNPDPLYPDALNQLEGFSHVWLVFVFHQHLGQAWRPKISPPRLEIDKVGVFASRAPHRPNPIGISAVKLDRIDLSAEGGIEVHLSGVDLLDGTPVLDIKPYIPYADSIPEAIAGWASEEIQRFPVHFSAESLRTIAEQSQLLMPRFREFLAETLSLDPRPISQRKTMPLKGAKTEGAIFRFRVSIFDVEWQVRGGEIHVLRLLKLSGA
ncbi:MAG: tRNA (N6-threonylcarbamoyladenosine(37)-N6)-methyltransferase TrmO [Bacteriovoracia bacterium]